MKYILLLLFFINSAFAGFPQGNHEKMYKDALQFKSILRTLTAGSIDPSSIATPGEPGDLYFGSSDVYIKTDSGSSTNWNVMINGSGGVIPIASGGTNSGTALGNNRVMFSQGNAIVESGLTLNGADNLSGINNLSVGGTTTLNTGLTGVAKLSSGVVSASDVNLTSEVTGVLPVANGGTNSSTALNNSRVIVSTAGAIVESATTTTQLGYLDATSSIQTQLNGKQADVMTTNGDIVYYNSGATRLPIGTANQRLQSNGTTVSWVSPTITTQGDILLGDGSGNESRLAIGASGTSLKSNGTTASWTAPTEPTIQIFTSGSGTYTTPADVLYLKVKMVGGGGGGAGSGTGGASAGAAGNNTTFGATTAGGGSAGGTSGAGGGGGTCTLGSGHVGAALTGGQGGSYQSSTPTNVFISGGHGGDSPYFGGGGSSAAGGFGTVNANTNSGGGGAGGGSGGTASTSTGAGGGSGGFCDFIIASPAASYSYGVGASASGGAAGTSGYGGSFGASGQIIVEEYYQ